MSSHGSMTAAAADLRSSRPGRRRRGIATVEALQARGDPEAAYAIGTWLLHGAYGYPQDVGKGAAYLQYAADHGVADAIYDLGQLAESERLGDRPRREAFNRYLTAAILGDRDAADEVVRCVYHGVGTFADKRGAERLFNALSTERQPRLAAE